MRRRLLELDSLKGFDARVRHKYLKGKFDTQLCRERDADSRAGAEKVPKRSGGEAQLVKTRNRLRLSACLVQAERRGIGKIIYRGGQRGNIGYIVGAGIVAVKEVEEFRKWRNRPSLANGERAAHAQVKLYVGRASQFVERRFHAFHHRPVSHRSCQRKRPSAFGLTEKRELETTRYLKCPSDNEPLQHVFA